MYTYLWGNVFGFSMQYLGLTAAAGSAVIASHNQTGDLREIALLVFGGGIYCFGKTIETAINRQQLSDELTRKGLERKIEE